MPHSSASGRVDLSNETRVGLRRLQLFGRWPMSSGALTGLKLESPATREVRTMSGHDVMPDWSVTRKQTNLRFPGESAEYRAARDRLLEREAELRYAMEAVAAARRELPPGGLVTEDYRFERLAPNGSPTTVRMSELFEPGKDTLLIYSFMFGPDREEACPMCTAFLASRPGRQADRRRPRRRRAQACGLPGDTAAAHQPGGGRRVTAYADRCACREAALAEPAAAIDRWQQLQPRLLRKDRHRNVLHRGARGRGLGDADDERVSSRRRAGPPLLGLRTVLRADRARTRPPTPRPRQSRAGPYRSHARRTIVSHRDRHGRPPARVRTRRSVVRLSVLRCRRRSGKDVTAALAAIGRSAADCCSSSSQTWGSNDAAALCSRRH